ncbi:MAG: hypothetical protein R3F61_03350 [Myxococcota bacterium]
MPEWLLELLSRADGDLMAGGYHAISVDPERVRRQLRTSGRPYVEPGGHAPSLDELDSTARWVIDQARFKTTALSGFAGLAGAPSVPPEIAARGVGIVRLAQRLSVVYGFDPGTDRGRTALWRALAAGLEVDLPEGPVEMRVSDVPTLLSPTLHPRSVGVVLAQALVYKSVLYVAGRFGRFVPLVSSGVAAAEAHRRTDQVGERMIAVLRRLSEPGALPVYADAQEV